MQANQYYFIIRYLIHFCEMKMKRKKDGRGEFMQNAVFFFIFDTETKRRIQTHEDKILEKSDACSELQSWLFYVFFSKLVLSMLFCLLPFIIIERERLIKQHWLYKNRGQTNTQRVLSLGGRTLKAKNRATRKKTV